MAGSLRKEKKIKKKMSKKRKNFLNNLIFTRLKAKTHMGRPNWNELFEQIVTGSSENKTKDVNVFFCGPKSMGEIVKTECIKHKLKFYKEQF
jgi:GTPase SAR1 family protein